MTNKHTPGPWRVMKANPSLVLGGALGYLVANCQNGRKSNDEDEANARLIAAAPETASERDRLKEINAELLAALQKVLHHIPVNDADVMWAARSAIAKATGQALQELADIGQELNI